MFKYVFQEKWDIIFEGKWDSREKIKVVGDVYMLMWDDVKVLSFVFWGVLCVRLEGGVYIGRGDEDICR